jgi:hypothetical protein
LLTPPSLTGNPGTGPSLVALYTEELQALLSMPAPKILVGFLKRLFPSNHYWYEYGYGVSVIRVEIALLSKHNHDGDFSALVHSPRQRRKSAGEDND